MLPRALERVRGSRRPSRLIESINHALSYLRQDAAKERARASKGRAAASTPAAPSAALMPHRPGSPEYDAEHARWRAILKDGSPAERDRARVQLGLIEKHGFLPAPKEPPS